MEQSKIVDRPQTANLPYYFCVKIRMLPKRLMSYPLQAQKNLLHEQL